MELLTLLVLSILPQVSTTVDDARYYPLEKGNRWVYDYSKTGFITDHQGPLEVEVFEKVEVAEGDRYELRSNGEDWILDPAQQISVGAEGIHLHSFRGRELKPALLLLKFPLRKGTVWTDGASIGTDSIRLKGTIVGKKAINVLSKLTDAIAARIQIQVLNERIEVTNEVTVSVWFVRDVGPVRYTISNWAGSVMLELQGFFTGDGKESAHNPYFSIKPGSVWNYDVRQIRRGSQGKPQNLRMVAKHNGDSTYVFQSVREGSEIGAAVHLEVSVEPSGIMLRQVLDYKLKPPLRVVSFPLTVGKLEVSKEEAYSPATLITHVQSREEMVLPTGTHAAYRLHSILLSRGKNVFSITVWLASGIGIARIHFVNPRGEGVEFELTSYKEK